jgi:hypothetical protein
LNYLLPVQIGAPDILNSFNKQLIKFKSIDENNNRFDSESDFFIFKFTPGITTYNYIGPYLSGLLEGDGHIILSKYIKGKMTYPYIAITFSNKHLPLINKLLELYGGRLRFKNKENAIVWTVNIHKELINLINLMNGYLRTPKLNKFNDLIL